MIQYKLSVNTQRGALINSVPLILESNKETVLFFYLSNGKSLTSDYYVTLTDKFGQKTYLQIKDSKVTLPAKLFYEQVISVSVEHTDGSKILKVWQCQPLKIAFYDNLQKAALTVGVDINGIADGLASLDLRVIDIENEAHKQTQQKAAQDERITQLESAYNKSLAVIEDLNSRLKIIENE